MKEAVETLKGNGPKDLLDLCLQSGEQMLMQAHIASDKLSKKMLEDVIINCQALHVLRDMVKSQRVYCIYLTS